MLCGVLDAQQSLVNGLLEELDLRQARLLTLCIWRTYSAWEAGLRRAILHLFRATAVSGPAVPCVWSEYETDLVAWIRLL